MCPVSVAALATNASDAQTIAPQRRKNLFAALKKF
jgi:hypothetical protein